MVLGMDIIMIVIPNKSINICHFSESYIYLLCHKFKTSEIESHDHVLPFLSETHPT